MFEIKNCPVCNKIPNKGNSIYKNKLITSFTCNIGNFNHFNFKIYNDSNKIESLNIEFFKREDGKFIVIKQIFAWTLDDENYNIIYYDETTRLMQFDNFQFHDINNYYQELNNFIKDSLLFI